MARKSFMYSVLEAVQYEMRQDKNMVWIFELTPPVASTPGKPVINLEKEFGRKRVVNTGIDENWMAGCVARLPASPARKAVTYIPYQGNCMCFQMIQNHAGKLRSMTGGMASMPIVFILEMTGQTPGFAGQHSDYEIDTYYAHIPGVKTVIPSTPTDAKGMMVSAIRDPNPVVLPLCRRPARTDRGGAGRAVHDAARQGRGAHDRQRHHDRRFRRRHARGAQGDRAAAEAGHEGRDDRPALPEADGHRDAGQVGAEDQAAADRRPVLLHAVPGRRGDRPLAENVDGARFKRIAFPDAPPPASPEMFLWMRPNADHIVAAAKKLVG